MSTRIAHGGVIFTLPNIPNDMAVADPADHNEMTFLSPLWAIMFGPLYFTLHGHWREAFVTAILLPVFGAGMLIAPFLVIGAWRRRAIDRADKKNLETLIALTIGERDHV